MPPLLIMAIGAMIAYVVFGRNEGAKDETLSDASSRGRGRVGNRQPNPPTEGNHRLNDRVSELFKDRESEQKETEETSPQVEQKPLE